MSSVENNREWEDLSGDPINNPFKPSDIKMDTQTVNLGYLIEMMKYDEINLQPDLQRGEGLWTDEQKSRLIESILLGLPLPSFYFYEESQEGEGTYKWAVIDGLQRLGTFRSFILEQDESKKLHLRNLEFITEYNGKNYDALSREDQRRISGSKITLNIIRKGTPDEVKYVIFKRVNTAGLHLTPQEIRHAVYHGRPAEFVRELAESPEFIEATAASISPQRMDDRYYANRFIAFYLQDYNTDYNGDLDLFMNTGMSLLKDKTREELQAIKDAFCRSMKLAFEIFGSETFRKPYRARQPQVSKAIFDTLSVNLAKLRVEEQSILLARKGLFRQEMTDLLNKSDFDKAISSSTGQQSHIKTRFGLVESLIRRIIQ
ncbi:MAG: DUF262 domain-containing protein [Tannerellaceae bacterium]|jgi:hypothetical protein|nr:DUF262 domain-containing protein [Tannerellaceae bacterium]